jgi:cell wall-associated NlpC family hydrolase
MDVIKYLQMPYEHMGRTPMGTDCFGLIRMFYNYELDIDLPDYTKPYSEKWWLESNYFLDLHKEWGFSKTDTYKLGNILLFYNTTHGVGHCGIVLDDSQFLHMTKTGGGVGNYRYGLWPRLIHSAYEYVGPRV